MGHANETGDILDDVFSRLEKQLRRDAAMRGKERTTVAPERSSTLAVQRLKLSRGQKHAAKQPSAHVLENKRRLLLVPLLADGQLLERGALRHQSKMQSCGHQVHHA